MKFEITEEEAKKAKVPHEIFLTNMVGNHILMFIAALGMAGSYWQPLAMVPVISISLIIYTLWRAKKSKVEETWYVMCHWQIAARRSRMFINMLLLMVLGSVFGWIGHAYLGMMEVAVYALVGGVAILPTMVTVLVLIVMESDAMHQAAQHKLPDSVVERYPNPAMKVIEEESP